MRRALQLVRGMSFWIGLLAISAAVHAHKASDAYLQIDATAQGLTVRWDIALRDLDAALGLDANEDGKLTWGEVKATWWGIQTYAMARLRIEGCDLRSTQQLTLERRNDGAYAVLSLASDCVLAQAPVIAYSLFREIDPTHRGIVKVQRAGGPLTLSVLDPTRGATPTSSAGVAEFASPVPPDGFAPSGAWGFLREGIRHILSGYDHVLFLLCLLLPSVMRRTRQGWQPVEKLSQAVWPIAGIVSAFTVAHSITLGLAATRVVSLSSALIEPAIAATIVVAALDNVWPIFPVKRVVVTFFFGLIHGFGFASVLEELNLPPADFAWALLQFNLGLELGQLLVVISLTGVLFLLRERRGYRNWVIRGGSFAAMLLGALWLIERSVNVPILPI